ncbi:NMT1/THI5 like domain-containing protein [Leptolyngbya sp. NIES-3755]|nr:NMT1/THI5 like domain-containing protein [Leptolyngbya sp. NIES-3755]
MSRTTDLLNRRQALWLMGGLVGSMALHGCNQTTANSSGTAPLKAGISPWPGYAGHYIATKKGFFKETGVTVQEINFPGATELITGFLAQQADVGWVTSGDAIQAAQQDPTMRIIYVVDYSNGADGIIGRGIKTPADLKGKTVARENLLFTNVLLREYLKKGGLTEADIKIKDLSAADAAAAFAAKQVDVAVAYEPWLTKTTKESGGEILFTSKDTNLIADVLATRQNIIATRKSELQAYIRAIDKGVKLINSGDPEAVKIVAAALNVSVDEAKQQLAGVKIFDIEMNKSIGFNSSNAKNIMKNLELSIDTGKQMKVIGDIKVENLYDDSIVKSL